MYDSLVELALYLKESSPMQCKSVLPGGENCAAEAACPRCECCTDCCKADGTCNSIRVLTRISDPERCEVCGVKLGEFAADPKDATKCFAHGPGNLGKR